MVYDIVSFCWLILSKGLEHADKKTFGGHTMDGSIAILPNRLQELESILASVSKLQKQIEPITTPKQEIEKQTETVIAPMFEMQKQLEPLMIPMKKILA